MLKKGMKKLLILLDVITVNKENYIEHRIVMDV